MFMDLNMNELLTAGELSKKIKISPQTIHRWRKKGMPSIKGERAVRFDYLDVLRWMKESRNK